MLPHRRWRLPGLALLAAIAALLTVLTAPVSADAGSAMTASRAPRFTNARLIAHHSGKCLEVAAGQTTNWARIQQWACDSTAPQQEWNITATDNRYYTVRNAHSNYCMSVAYVSSAEDASVIQWECLIDASGQYWYNQQWKLDQRSNGYFWLVARHSGKCLEILNGDTYDGAEAVQATCTPGRASQEWQLT